MIMVLGIMTSGRTKISHETAELFDTKPTLYFWYTDDSLSDYFSSMALKFNEEYNVRVIPVLQSGVEYLENINQQSLYTETVPDLYLIGNDSLEKSYLSGLASVIEDNGLVGEENFSDAAIYAVTYKDKIVGYPYYAETSALLYNKTLLEELANTQILAEIDTETGEAAQELVDTSEDTDDLAVDTEMEELTEEELENAVAERLPTLIPSTFEELLTFANSYDAPAGVEAVFKWDVEDVFYNYFFIGNFMNVGGLAGDNEEEISIYNMDAITAMMVYQNLNQFFYIEADDVAYVDVIQDFMDGKILFTTATTDVIGTLENAKAEESFDFEYCFASIPELTDELETKNLSVTNTIVINGYSEQKELANQFAQFLAIDNADSVYEKTQKMSAKLDGNDAYPDLTYFVMEYAESVPMPKLMTTSNFWVELEIAFSHIWNGASVTDTLKDLSEQIMTQVTGEVYEETYIAEPMVIVTEDEYTE